jgi:hypothetical protein
MLKLSVNIGASLQVKNAKGEWDWIKPEVGAELTFETYNENTQHYFNELWEEVVGPQFKSVVNSLLNEQSNPTINSSEPLEEVVVNEGEDY